MSDQLEPVYTGQGTRLDEKAPWMSWDAEMDDPSLTAELVEEIAEYAKNRYEEAQSSNESEEVLAEWKEGNDAAADDANQWIKKAEYQDEGAREGRVMSHAEFINLLRKAGVHCHYRQHPHKDKATLYWMHGGLEEKGPWVQLGNVPELSMMNFDEHGVPLAEKRRGWRTVLLQLILQGAITEDQANIVFGKPKLTAAFSRYNSTMYQWRNRHGGWHAE